MIRAAGLSMMFLVPLVLAAGNAVAQTDAARIPPAPHGGWMSTPRRDAVTPQSGKRNHVFTVGEPITFALGPSADNYEVRDYWGNLVDSGPAGMQLTVAVEQPGWYKLYIYGARPEPVEADPFADMSPDARESGPWDMDDWLTTGPDDAALTTLLADDRDIDPGIEAWGEVVGGTTFVIFRDDPRFPPLPAPDTPGGHPGHHGRIDQVMRGVTGMGPQRHSVDAADPERSIEMLEFDVAIDKEYYLPYDPVRSRSLMAAFPRGTKNRLEGVRTIVAHFKDVIHYWEPRNEPNQGATGAGFLRDEMIDFYNTVKGVDPTLKVMGPGTVTINPGPNGLGFIEDFLKAGGGDYIDAFSFHIYGSAFGDLPLIRQSMGALTDLLKQYGLADIELWQTEAGYAAAAQGTYQPRRHGQRTMMQMLTFEQYGLPKEQNHWWYDRSHGFWAVPCWWINRDGSLNPAGPLMRVYSEELYGKTFAKAYTFGPSGDNLYVGNLYRGDSGAVAAFMSAGSPYGRITLDVSGADRLHVVSAFGVERLLSVDDNQLELPVPELPVYVRVPEGVEIAVVPVDYGPNLALADGVTATTSSDGRHPLDGRRDAVTGAAVEERPNDIAKLVNGILENQLWDPHPDNDFWFLNIEDLPGWVEIRLPEATDVSRVIVYAGTTWNWRGSLLDFDVQVERNGAWVPVAQVREDPRTFPVFTPPINCTVDSFFSGRWSFNLAFEPVSTRAIRLYIRDGISDVMRDWLEAIDFRPGPHAHIRLREIEIYEE